MNVPTEKDLLDIFVHDYWPLLETRIRHIFLDEEMASVKSEMVKQIRKGINVMNIKELDKILDNHKLWLRTNGEEGERANLIDANLIDANLRGANLERANLRGANLRGANLERANLRGANLIDANLIDANLRDANLIDANLRGANLIDADLDFSAFPLWCGGLDVNIDDKQATQFLYHLVRNVQFSKNTSKEMKKLCKIKSIIKKANEFHRVDECGRISTSLEK